MFPNYRRLTFKSNISIKLMSPMSVKWTAAARFYVWRWTGSGTRFQGMWHLSHFLNVLKEKIGLLKWDCMGDYIDWLIEKSIGIGTLVSFLFITVHCCSFTSFTMNDCQRTEVKLIMMILMLSDFTGVIPTSLYQYWFKSKQQMILFS